MYFKNWSQFIMPCVSDGQGEFTDGDPLLFKIMDVWSEVVLLSLVMCG